jgi:hypothetical protein
MDAQEWNSRLIEAVFSTRAGATPVRIIKATNGFLARVMGSKSGSELDARADFIGAHGSTGSEIRALFDFDAQMLKWRRSSGPPTFFGPLYLSLLVASASEDTQNVADFRRRLCKIFSLPPGNYVSNGLPLLWQALERWLRNEATPGGQYRTLSLPNPGHETIIGYSKRLAFPGFRDLGRLARLLFDNDLTHESPLDAIFDALGPRLKTFSKDFEAEYTHLRRIIRTDSTGAFLSPMWAAIESASFEPIGRTAHARTRFALELWFDEFDQPDTHLFTDTPLSRTLDSTVSASAAISAIEGCAFILRLRSGDNALASLLSVRGPLRRAVKSSPIGRQIEQGCLVFAPDPSVPWLWRASLPRAGPVKFICREPVTKLLTRFLGTSSTSAPHPYPIDHAPDWFLMDVSDCSTIARRRSTLDGFAAYDALRPGLISPRLILLGAIRIRDGILLSHASCPEVLAVGCDSVILSCDDPTDDPRSFGLLDSGPEPYCFRATVEQIDQLELPKLITLTGRHGSEPMTSYRVLADSCVPDVPLTLELDIAAYLEESSFGQLSSIDASAESDKKWQANPNRAAALERLGRSTCRVEAASAFRSLAPYPVAPAWDDLFEALYGSFLNARSLSETRVLELASRGIDDADAHPTTLMTLLWHGMKIRRLWDRRWRGVSYTPVKPYLRFNSSSGELRLIGLTSVKLRQRFKESGRSLEQSDTPIGPGPGPTMFGVELPAAEAIADRLGLPLDCTQSPTVLLPASVIVGTLSLRYRERPASAGIRYWKPSIGMFGDAVDPGTQLVLRLVGHDRTHSMYEILQGKELLWATESRAWAILMYRLLCGDAGYSRDGSCIVSDQPLPFVFARAAIQDGGGIASNSLERRTLWAYRFRSLATLDQFLGSTRPRSASPAPTIARWASSLRNDNIRSDIAGIRTIFAKRYARTNSGD